MRIAKRAEEECDRKTLTFIDWFITEQVQEEEAVKNIIKRLERFGEENSSLLLIDQELAKREN